MTWLVVLAVLAIDQVTKVGYEGRLNSSVAFTNLDSTQTPAQMALIALLLGLAWRWPIRYGPWWATGLAVGGLLSLVIDRVVHGGVRDPIAYGPAWWNLADLLGLVGLAACVWTFASTTRKEGEPCSTDGSSRPSASPGSLPRSGTSPRDHDPCAEQPAGVPPHRPQPEEETMRKAVEVLCKRCGVHRRRNGDLCLLCLLDRRRTGALRR